MPPGRLPAGLLAVHKCQEVEAQTGVQLYTYPAGRKLHEHVCHVHHQTFDPSHPAPSKDAAAATSVTSSAWDLRPKLRQALSQRRTASTGPQRKGIRSARQHQGAGTPLDEDGPSTSAPAPDAARVPLARLQRGSRWSRSLRLDLFKLLALPQPAALDGLSDPGSSSSTSDGSGSDQREAHSAGSDDDSSGDEVTGASRASTPRPPWALSRRRRARALAQLHQRKAQLCARGAACVARIWPAAKALLVQVSKYAALHLQAVTCPGDGAALPDGRYEDICEARERYRRLLEGDRALRVGLEQLGQTVWEASELLPDDEQQELALWMAQQPPEERPAMLRFMAVVALRLRTELPPSTARMITSRHMANVACAASARGATPYDLAELCKCTEQLATQCATSIADRRLRDDQRTAALGLGSPAQAALLHAFATYGVELEAWRQAMPEPPQQAVKSKLQAAAVLVHGTELATARIAHALGLRQPQRPTAPPPPPSGSGATARRFPLPQPRLALPAPGGEEGEARLLEAIALGRFHIAANLLADVLAQHGWGTQSGAAAAVRVVLQVVADEAPLEQGLQGTGRDAEGGGRRQRSLQGAGSDGGGGGGGLSSGGRGLVPREAGFIARQRVFDVMRTRTWDTVLGLEGRAEEAVPVACVGAEAIGAALRHVALMGVATTMDRNMLSLGGVPGSCAALLAAALPLPAVLLPGHLSNRPDLLDVHNPLPGVDACALLTYLGMVPLGGQVRVMQLVYSGPHMACSSGEVSYETLVSELCRALTGAGRMRLMCASDEDMQAAVMAAAKARTLLQAQGREVLLVPRAGPLASSAVGAISELNDLVTAEVLLLVRQHPFGSGRGLGRREVEAHVTTLSNSMSLELWLLACRPGKPTELFCSLP